MGEKIRNVYQGIQSYIRFSGFCFNFEGNEILHFDLISYAVIG